MSPRTALIDLSHDCRHQDETPIWVKLGCNLSDGNECIEFQVLVRFASELFSLSKPQHGSGIILVVGSFLCHLCEKMCSLQRVRDIFQVFIRGVQVVSRQRTSDRLVGNCRTNAGFDALVIHYFQNGGDLVRLAVPCRNLSSLLVKHVSKIRVLLTLSSINYLLGAVVKIEKIQERVK